MHRGPSRCVSEFRVYAFPRTLKDSHRFSVSPIRCDLSPNNPISGRHTVILGLHTLAERTPRGPRPVTAEAAGSSPVVPVIFFKHLQFQPFGDQGILGDDKRKAHVRSFFPTCRSLHESCFRQKSRSRHYRFHELLLRRALRLRCRLQVFVGDMKIAVPQVIADRQLMFSHLCEHGSDCMSKGVPADSKMPTDLNAGWIFFFSTEARSRGFFPLSLSEGNTKCSAWL